MCNNNNNSCGCGGNLDSGCGCNSNNNSCGCGCGCNQGSNDLGPNPIIANINQLARNNTNFRNTYWTGDNLQVTLMSIPVGCCIGLEVHHDNDQFIYIVQGEALVQLGESQCPSRVGCGNAVIVPSGTWHNITNIGNVPLKLYSIYAPPHHPRGTCHRTKCDAEREMY